jgi:hypothetical protein
MFSRYHRTFEVPTMKHRVRWDSKKESSDTTGLTYDLAWSAAGGARIYPRLYQVCPWDSDRAEGPEYQWNDLFPRDFVGKLREFMQKPEGSVFAVHTTAYYNAIWTTMYNSIKRDPVLWENSKVQAYVKEVMRNTRWCKNFWLRGQKEFSMTRGDEHDEDIKLTIDVWNSVRLDRRPEYPTSETMAKR